MEHEIVVRATEYATRHARMRLTNEAEDRWRVECSRPQMEIITTGQELATKFLVEMEKIARTYYEMKRDAT